jgi:hypothetical protein
MLNMTVVYAEAFNKYRALTPPGTNNGIPDYSPGDAEIPLQYPLPASSSTRSSI